MNPIINNEILNDIVFHSVLSEDDTYLVKLGEDQIVVFSAKKNLENQISSLQFILSRLTMEDREFSRLDLRFDKPIIVLEK